MLSFSLKCSRSSPKWATPRKSCFSTSSQRLTHYDVLGVPQTASKSQIKSHFYKLSKTHHPDVSNNPESAKVFRKASEAYAILGNDRERRAYDRTILHQASPPASTQSFYQPSPSKRGPRASHAWEHRTRKKPPSPERPYPNSSSSYANRHYDAPKPYRHALHHDVLVGQRRRTEEEDQRVDRLKREVPFLRAVQVTSLLLLAVATFSGFGH
ncbi:DnaJ domain-containing protein [Crepidotus variabilis]|uniref:DnaJ domain-containing protein n=1 Tax=Crepidotus variabilis TaxID=179855 RepID=A0A9P6EFR3_9AGAR|nr:DnaJ domain-containing protein [Crepidotus variabilis]